jgi:hypothetical protein
MTVEKGAAVSLRCPQSSTNAKVGQPSGADCT